MKLEVANNNESLSYLIFLVIRCSCYRCVSASVSLIYFILAVSVLLGWYIYKRGDKDSDAVSSKLYKWGAISGVTFHSF